MAPGRVQSGDKKEGKTESIGYPSLGWLTALKSHKSEASVGEEELKRVLDAYELGELKRRKQVGSGFVNENWIIETTRGRYFFKCRHPDLRNADILLAQHDLVNHLRQSGFQAPAILPTLSGETLLVMDDEFYEIQEFVEGLPYEHRRPAHFEAAAVTLGHYHRCVQGFAPRVLKNLGDLYCPERLTLNLKRLAEAWNLHRKPALTRILRQLETHAADLNTRFNRHGELPFLVIHGDFHGGNLLFEGDRVVVVVDYDKSRWQPRVIELAEVLSSATTPAPSEQVMPSLSGDRVTPGNLPTVWETVSMRISV
jgi:Ser/Thr protein kinase RdoA (MazF antagonist)